MPDQLVIDALDFARSSKALQGSITLSDLGRLSDYLTSSAGELAYTVIGLPDECDGPMLKITVSGIIGLNCQRCLETIEHALNVKTALFLARNEDELSRYDEDIFVDAIYASNELDILALIEDEVILSLPVSPRHEDAGCHLSGETGIREAAAREHPFTVLASLKRPH